MQLQESPLKLRNNVASIIEVLCVKEAKQTLPSPKRANCIDHINRKGTLEDAHRDDDLRKKKRKKRSSFHDTKGHF